MVLALVFWILVLLKLILGGAVVLAPANNNVRWAFGTNLIDFMILIVIGLRLFVSPLVGH